MAIIGDQYKDPTSLYKWSKILIIISIGMHVVAVASGFMEYQFLTKILDGTYRYINSEELYFLAESNDFREMIVGIIQVLLFIIQGIVILMWIYRVNKNLHAFGVKEMNYTPGWAVGWYFIPLLSLWKPYQAMKEIFIKSEGLTDHPKKNQRYLLPTWWALWIITEVIARILLRNMMKNDLDIDGYVTLSLLFQLSDALEIVLNIVFLLIITAVYKWQMAYKNQQEGSSTIDMLIQR